jgi:hypothetical protein
MKLTSLLASTLLLGTVAISTASLPAFNPNSFQVSAQAMSMSKSESQGKIDQILAIKGKPGSGDLLRKLYKEDLTPIGIQVGGAGMVVNLYSKKDNTTLSLCTVYDVVVAAKKGRISLFRSREVK